MAFKSRGSKICLCVSIFIFLLLVAAGITIGVFASQFRTPTSQVQSMTPNLSSGPGLQNGQLSLTWDMSIMITNPNSFDIYVTSTTYKTYLVNGTTNRVPFGQGTKTDYNLPGKNATTTVKIDYATPLNIDVIQTLVKLCTNGDNKLTIEYQVEAWAKVFGMGPFRAPDKTGTQLSDCPRDLPPDVMGLLAGFL